jgi:hypothetical protein
MASYMYAIGQVDSLNSAVVVDRHMPMMRQPLMAHMHKI